MMKKRLIYGMGIGACALMLTGCGVKTLECKSDLDDMKMEISLKHDGKKFTEGSAKMEMEFPEEYAEELEGENLCDYMGDLGAAYNNCKSDYKDNKLTLSFDIDAKKLEEDEKDFKEDMTIEEAKKYFEADGEATCEIK